MKNKKAFIFVLYLTSLVLLPSCISFLVHKSVEFWVIHFENTSQSEIVFNTIQEKSMIEKFIELKELFLLDEMIKEYPEPRRQKFIITMHKETLQLIKMYNEERIQMFFHFWTNIICFIILSGYYILCNEELRFLNSWIQEFLYNLSDTIKAFFIILVTDFCVGFHSPHIWELMIESVYKDFGFPHNDLIISILLSSCPVILDTIFKYSIFFYLNRLSPSLVVIYHSMKE
uniref:envelope membrane carbon uptake protein n=1 Tax=Triadenum breviflorum TaxID=1157646 RepID=UPI002001383B|nr:envelope membrane carbon uptake protein [Triadenum breviflorum]UNQ87236.1 envelope membrane carbon uptake protein [Triadenum breviflorum]